MTNQFTALKNHYGAVVRYTFPGGDEKPSRSDISAAGLSVVHDAQGSLTRKKSRAGCMTGAL
jgi:hypothetical protein